MPEKKSKEKVDLEDWLIGVRENYNFLYKDIREFEDIIEERPK